MAVRFGFSMDLRNPEAWHRPWPDHYAEHIEFIAWAETLGFESVWLAEHHGIADGFPPSPLVIGAAIAARTKTLRIATGVALAPFYYPVRLAEDTAVLDVISNGRFEIALGVGYLQAEADAYGIDFKTRGRRTDEIMQIVRKLWQGEDVTWKGEFFDLKSARISPLPVQKPSIPMFVGALTPPAFRRAALYGDGYSGPLENYPAYLEAVRAAGKPDAAARISLVSAYDMWTFVSDDPEAALEEIAPHAYYSTSSYAQWQQGTSWGLKAEEFNAFKKSGLVKVFTPEAAVTHIKSRLALAPIESFALKVPTGMPLSKFVKYAELFARKVLPAVRQ